jgi:FG-GAP-like repeat
MKIQRNTIRACLLAGVLLALLPAFGQNNAVRLSSSQSIVTDPDHFIGSHGAVAGFFHRNRKLDFLYGGQDRSRSTPSDYYYLATNNGNGTFTTTPATPCDYVPNFSTDLNGDGIWDIWCSNSSTVQYGDGNGGFGPSFGYPPGSFPDALDAVAADFNGDGRPDIAVITVARQLQIFLNQGGRVFTSVHIYPLPSFSGPAPAVKLLAEDLNGDHKYDLVLIYGGANSSVTPYVATSDGAFTQGATTAIGAFVPPVISAAGRDVNHDGYGDIAVITGSGVKFMFGTPAGPFVPGPAIASPGAGCFAGSSGTTKGLACMVLADLSGDGSVDLAITGTTRVSPTTAVAESYVRVYIGNGQGQFSSPTQYSIPSFPKVLIAGDVNGTGRLDLTVATETQVALTVLRNLGNGRFSSAITTPTPNAHGIVAADFNRDGKPDIAVVNTPSCAAPCNGAITVAMGSGSTYFNTPSRDPIGMHGAAIAAGDLNHDGFLDLVVTNAIAGDNADIAVLLGTATGSFLPARSYTLGSLSHDAFLADVNKDGKLDLIEDGGVALGKGDGTFGPLTAFPAGLGFSATNYFTVADFNGDGNPDVAFAALDQSGVYGSIQILLGNGRGGWSVGQYMSLNQPITFITAGIIRPGQPIDIVFSYKGLNGIASGSEIDTGVTVIPGNGDGTFNESARTDAIIGADYAYQFFGPAAIGDFNGDGKPDVGVTDPVDGEFAVAPGYGDGTFGPSALYSAVNNASGIATADFDGNGLSDVILSSTDGLTRLYAQPVPSVSPGRLNFPVSVGGSMQTVTVKNTFASAISITAAISMEPSIFSIPESTCGASLAPGGSCTITVQAGGAGSAPPRDLLIASNGIQIIDIPLTYR